MKQWKYKAQMTTKYGVGCEGVKAESLEQANEKAVNKYKDKLVSVWDVETGEEITVEVI